MRTPVYQIKKIVAIIFAISPDYSFNISSLYDVLIVIKIINYNILILICSVFIFSIPVQNSYNPQTHSNTTAEPSFVTNFYENFSNSLQKKNSSESSTPTVISSNKCVVVNPSIPNTSNLVQASKTSTATTTTAGTLLTFKPTNQKTLLPGTSNHNSADNTIFVGNKQYQLVKSPSGQIKALVNGNKILMKSPPTVTVKVSSHNFRFFMNSL